MEIRDATHFRGKGALEVQDLIREELKELSANLLSAISKTQGRKSMVHSSSHDDPGDSTQ